MACSSVDGGSTGPRTGIKTNVRLVDRRPMILKSTGAVNIIPPTQRADGTWRKEIKTKVGYTPPDEQPPYSCKPKEEVKKAMEEVKKGKEEPPSKVADDPFLRFFSKPPEPTDEMQPRVYYIEKAEQDARDAKIAAEQKERDDAAAAAAAAELQRNAREENAENHPPSDPEPGSDTEYEPYSDPEPEPEVPTTPTPVANAFRNFMQDVLTDEEEVTRPLIQLVSDAGGVPWDELNDEERVISWNTLVKVWCWMKYECEYDYDE